MRQQQSFLEQRQCLSLTPLFGMETSHRTGSYLPHAMSVRIGYGQTPKGLWRYEQRAYISYQWQRMWSCLSAPCLTQPAVPRARAWSGRLRRLPGVRRRSPRVDGTGFGGGCGAWAVCWPRLSWYARVYEPMSSGLQEGRARRRGLPCHGPGEVSWGSRARAIQSTWSSRPWTLTLREGSISAVE